MVKINLHSHSLGQKRVKGRQQKLLEENTNDQQHQNTHANTNPHIKVLYRQDIPKENMEEVGRTLGNANQNDPQSQEGRKSNSDSRVTFDNRIALDISDNNGS